MTELRDLGEFSWVLLVASRWPNPTTRPRINDLPFPGRYEDEAGRSLFAQNPTLPYSRVASIFTTDREYSRPDSMSFF